jgi:hypothetical protein
MGLVAQGLTAAQNHYNQTRTPPVRIPPHVAPSSLTRLPPFPERRLSGDPFAAGGPSIPLDRRLPHVS